MDYCKNNLIIGAVPNGYICTATSSQLDTAETDDTMRVTCHFVSRLIPSPSKSALIAKSQSLIRFVNATESPSKKDPRRMLTEGTRSHISVIIVFGQETSQGF